MSLPLNINLQRYVVTSDVAQSYTWRCFQLHLECTSVKKADTRYPARMGISFWTVCDGNFTHYSSTIVSGCPRLGRWFLDAHAWGADY
ncbi:MAG: hypothetical protein VXZ05_01750 [Pseudomonadota bacterium]|nr:hypothetical protein [Pseudomonadota bacterium]